MRLRISSSLFLGRKLLAPSCILHWKLILWLAIQTCTLMQTIEQWPIWKPENQPSVKKLWVKTPWTGVSDKKDHQYVPFSTIFLVKVIYTGVEEEGGKMGRKGIRNLKLSADTKKGNYCCRWSKCVFHLQKCRRDWQSCVLCFLYFFGFHWAGASFCTWMDKID